MKKKAELGMGLFLLLAAVLFAKKGVVLVFGPEQAASACIVKMPGMEVVDNASDENNENTRRKATVVPIKIEYV